jgi:hypothetical protein
MRRFVQAMRSGIRRIAVLSQLSAAITLSATHYCNSTYGITRRKWRPWHTQCVIGLPKGASKPVSIKNFPTLTRDQDNGGAIALWNSPTFDKTDSPAKPNEPRVAPD